MHKKAIIRWLVFLPIILLFFQIKVSAQEASAEYITSVAPAKMESGEAVKDGVQNLFFKDNTLYVIDVWSGLQIIDVVNPKKPKVIATFKTDHRAKNVFVEEQYAYFANEIAGVTVLDVSNLSSIRPYAQFKTKGDAYYVVAKFPYVYVAEEEKGVNIYDITDGANPKWVGGYDTPGWAWGLALDGNLLYVADKSKGMVILDVSDPSAPKKAGGYPNMKNTKTIQIEDTLAYVADGPDGLWILNIRDPQKPTVVSKFNVEGYAYSAFKSGNTVFVSNESGQRLEMVNIRDIKHPRKEADYQAGANVYASWKNDVILYVAADKEMQILKYNRAPVIEPIANQQVDEMQQLTVVPDAYDPDKNPIYFSVKNLPEGAEFDTLTGTLTWTPNYEQSGLYPEITIIVTERTSSSLSSRTQFDIDVKHVNRNPSLPEMEDYTIKENEEITIVVPEGSDPDIEDKGRLTYSCDDLPEGAAFDSTTSTFTWTPNYDQSGVYTIPFSVHDGAGGIATQTSTVTVLHVDRKPVLEAVPPQTVDENQQLTIQLKGSDPDKEDQDKLSYKAENLPEGAVFDAEKALFTWTPTYDQSGEYKNILFIFTAGALSDSAFVDITVNHVNRPPVLNDIAAKTVDESKQLHFAVSGSDPDVEDEGKLVYSAENLPEGAKFNPDSLTFTWTPTYDQAGSYQVTFKVQDAEGSSASKTVNITVNNVNRAPTLADIEPQTVDENKALTVTLKGEDPDKEDADKLQYSADKLPQGASLNGNVFTWTPTYDQSGEYTINFTVSDGEFKETKEMKITVNHVNRPPKIADISAQKVKENSELTFKVSGSDEDKEDEGKLQLSASNLPEGASFDAASGKFSWKPGYNQAGSYTVKFTATDPQGLTADKEVTITVEDVNRKPAIDNISPLTTEEGSSVSFTATAKDEDKEDSNKLKFSSSNLPAGAKLDASTGKFTWTPSVGQAGSYSVKIKVSDGKDSAETTAKIKVTAKPQPPADQGTNNGQ